MNTSVWFNILDLYDSSCYDSLNIYFSVLITLWAASNYNIHIIFSNSLSLLLQWNHMILFSYAFGKVCIEYLYLYVSKHWRRLLWKESRMRNALTTVNASVFSIWCIMVEWFLSKITVLEPLLLENTVNTSVLRRFLHQIHPPTATRSVLFLACLVFAPKGMFFGQR